MRKNLMTSSDVDMHLLMVVLVYNMRMSLHYCGSSQSSGLIEQRFLHVNV